jgi:hypothetical protein
MDRTHVSKNAQSVLQAPSFLERVKGALELLRARNGTFGKFVARALRENADERSGAALRWVGNSLALHTATMHMHLF